MISVGSSFPAFSLNAVVSIEEGQEFDTISNETFSDKWKVYFFWPKDFTFVCPTEITAFAELNGEFMQRGAQLIGGSTDSDYVHLAWRNNHSDLKNLPFPMISDIKRELCAELGILDSNAGVAQRATFIVDSENIVRHISVNDLSVGRNPNEIIRILDALQTNSLCPCNWKAGEATL